MLTKAKTSVTLPNLTESIPEYEFLDDCIAKVYMYIPSATQDSASCAGFPEVLKLHKDSIRSYIRRDDYTCVYFTHNYEGKEIPVFLAVNTEDNYVRVITGYNDLTVAEAVLEEIINKFPKIAGTKDTQIPVDFFVLGANGPKKINRLIDTEPYADIVPNYPTATKDFLDKLVAFNPTKGGQMILLSGAAGTGKTNFLRGLFHSWKSWATFTYIVDPITMFGGNSSYLTSLIFDKDADPWDTSEEKPSKWRVILMEDVGELLQSDAKQQVGQGLSQLLNVTDGFIGQGLKLLFVLTTNDLIEKLHPAVSRPGRCAFKHEFNLFSKEEANRWLKDHNLPEDVTSRISLADLYARKDGSAVTHTDNIARQVGFTAGR